jgi:outer membrane protein
MLRITVHDSPGTLIFKLEGSLAGPWVGELECCWQRIAEQSAGRAVEADLNEVAYVDAAGRRLLERMHAAGVRLSASGPLVRSMVEQIVGKAVLIFAALLSLATILPAQERLTMAPPLPGQAGPVLRLTLRDAVQLALKQNPQVQIGTINVALSQQDQRIARSGLLPSASLQTLERTQRVNLEAQIGLSFPGIPQHAGPFETFQAGPQFNIPILDLTQWRRWQASKEAVRGAQAQSSGVREQTVALVVSQYLGALRASANASSARSRAALAEALYRQAADIQKAGVGTGIDTLRANVQLQGERQRVMEADTQLRTALFGLARVINADPAARVELADERTFFETPPVDLDRSLEAAWSHRTELEALESQRRGLELARRGARESRLPVLRGLGFWAYQGTSPLTVIPAYVYQFQADIPLFTGGRIGAEVARAELALRRVEQQRTETRNQIAFEVKSALAEMESARSQVDVANLAVKLANEEVVQARDRFQAGVANNIEVITAQDALARATDNQIVALYRYNQSRADLARAAGVMENLYAK